jgi:hypothetical protein
LIEELTLVKKVMRNFLCFTYILIYVMRFIEAAIVVFLLIQNEADGLLLDLKAHLPIRFRNDEIPSCHKRKERMTTG